MIWCDVFQKAGIFLRFPCFLPSRMSVKAVWGLLSVKGSKQRQPTSLSLITGGRVPDTRNAAVLEHDTKRQKSQPFSRVAVAFRMSMFTVGSVSSSLRAKITKKTQYTPQWARSVNIYIYERCSHFFCSTWDALFAIHAKIWKNKVENARFWRPRK